MKHTQAVMRLRTESQRFLNFVVLTSSAVPQLRTALTAPGVDLVTLSLTPPDYFKGQGCEPSRLLTLIPGYEEELAHVSVITLFSYFEAYIKGALAELIQFHGGPEAFIGRADRRSRAFLAATSAPIKEAKRAVQEPAKSNKRERYQKHTKTLVAAGYRFPTELLSSYGVRMLIKKAHPKTGLKAWEIPDILAHGLHFDMTEQWRDRLHSIRELRNQIAHGAAPAVTMKMAMGVARDLHTLTARIDAHLVEHFFVLEEYA